MKGDLFAAARLLVVATIGLVGVAVFAPGRLELGVRVYALVVCATAIVLVVLALRRAYPPETTLREPVTRAPTSVAPPSLGRIEHEIALGVSGSFDLHYRLVPRLRGLVSGLLSARRRVTLETSPETARAVLGEDVWELVRPGRPAPEDRLAKGIAPRELGRVVDALEAI